MFRRLVVHVRWSEIKGLNPLMGVRWSLQDFGCDGKRETVVNYPQMSILRGAGLEKLWEGDKV
jgi:hypothetical protein